MTAKRRNLLDAAYSIENAETFLVAADRADEAPTQVLALLALRLRQVRETVEILTR